MNYEKNKNGSGIETGGRFEGRAGNGVEDGRPVAADLQGSFGVRRTRRSSRVAHAHLRQPLQRRVHLCPFQTKLDYHQQNSSKIIQKLVIVEEKSSKMTEYWIIIDQIGQQSPKIRVQLSKIG